MNINYDFKFKILLLGDTWSGKSSLFTRYVDNIFKNGGHLATIGLDYKTKLIVFDKYKIFLQIWDTAGQVRFRTITKTYYKGSDGFIFNFNITDENTLKEMDFFINNVKEEKKNDYDSIICANYFDLEEERIFTDEEIKKYEKKYNIKIFETSAKTGLNIDRAFNHLIFLMLQRKANKQILSSRQNWMNNQTNNFEISIFKEPNCENKLKNEYIFYNKKLNINDNSNFNADGIIFYINTEYKGSFEYILNEINNMDDDYLNKKRNIMFIMVYQENKDKENDIINKELDILYNKKGINIFKVFNENDISESIEKLAKKISFDGNKGKINIKLNKYLNF